MSDKEAARLAEHVVREAFGDLVAVSGGQSIFFVDLRSSC